ncbi:PfaD family polyunsaturated fatty acid/polyketide biosynthesis protein [Chrysosporum bergii ANA360D]|uniref:PfaD family polyunsaturated fatty acid/polyketide biosynthesis protein n=1 Tax=Chrysosporum bergii ANA360D TaxID=617107 RepID=A0AA43GU45_9CYAN|nr:PfaD family polyunsaturated fatty acid/polyketide biosynthesis protein [Chrysosporum bergii]MDH6061600.1 PfaD family polyunsaturated fatty acid/polyketide biosynthesis protein [Chrysosporum bergii ANA360D]
MTTTQLKSSNNQLRFDYPTNSQGPVWQGSLDAIAFDEEGIKAKLSNLELPCYFVSKQGQIGATNEGYLVDGDVSKSGSMDTITAVPPLMPQQLGDPKFQAFHGVKYAYGAGAMANGIASEELVIALGKAKILGSFGAGGLVPSRIEKAIHSIQEALPKGPYAFNLIHSPSENAIERGSVDLYLKYGVTTIEASAFLDLTPNIVYYRAAGLSLNAENQIQIKNKVIAKISRPEVATKFLQPAPEKILKLLVSQGLITELQAKLAAQVPMADDITAEADSGGHTDNRSLVCLLPAILSLRDEISEKYCYQTSVRVGAAGGIGTPHSALAAFMMGAAYVVTGSVNQSCIESGASAHSKKLLAEAGMADVMMAPAADMFEMGVKLQVLKRGTLFPMRSQRLFELYRAYNSIDEIPATERQELEKQVFRKTLEEVWQETVAYFSQRDPEQITRAENNPKRKMALIFRWYLGLSSRWANTGEASRAMDYQIWCGPAMGAFNTWVKESYLAEPNHRRVVDVAEHIMTGAAYLYRLHNLKLQGLLLPSTTYGVHHLLKRG